MKRTKTLKKLSRKRKRTRRLRRNFIELESLGKGIELKTRRLRKYRGRGGGTIPNTNPSLEDLKGQGAVFANPEKVDDYESFDLTKA
jgi:hypothetical protein